MRKYIVFRPFLFYESQKGKQQMSVVGVFNPSCSNAAIAVSGFVRWAFSIGNLALAVVVGRSGCCTRLIFLHAAIHVLIIVIPFSVFHFILLILISFSLAHFLQHGNCSPKFMISSLFAFQWKSIWKIDFGPLLA